MLYMIFIPPDTNNQFLQSVLGNFTNKPTLELKCEQVGIRCCFGN